MSATCILMLIETTTRGARNNTRVISKPFESAIINGPVHAGKNGQREVA